MATIEPLASLGDDLTLSYWSTNKVVFRRERREAWIPVFKHWREIVDHYHRITDDHCWWHTEASNLSMLGAAIIRAEHIAIHEYSVDRNTHGGRARGRADIWISVGEASYLLEAKQRWNSIQSNAGLSILNKNIGWAIGQAGRYSEDRQFVGGIVFATAHTTRSRKIQEDVTKWRNADRSSITDTASHGLIVDYYPRRKLATITSGAARPRYYPGTTIVMAFDRVT
ncbi:MAG: hypothetical protein Q8S73_40020 [Deltaproteobacteria bacterium]|nr:hypothetical protein [Myxococcales bacterium]MDP3220353.1 hypothetical protein [Deltaproteobacteria bacterium]